MHVVICIQKENTKQDRNWCGDLLWTFDLNDFIFSEGLLFEGLNFSSLKQTKKIILLECKETNNLPLIGSLCKYPQQLG